jgi:DNA-binding NarL/FixJ family response regulator
MAAANGFAGVLLARGEEERAVRVLSAADAARVAAGVKQPLNHGLQRRVEMDARARLGEERFASAWSAGREVSLDAAVEEALRPVSERPPAVASVAQPTGLTAREREVLALLVDGLTDRQIAESLYISHRTTQVHVASIFGKLNVNNRTAAASAAMRLGIAGTESESRKAGGAGKTEQS